MNVQEILVAIPTLSFEERMIVLKAITNSLSNSERQKHKRGVGSGELRGVLKTSHPPPTDEEVKEAYTEYLLEKYK